MKAIISILVCLFVFQSAVAQDRKLNDEPNWEPGANDPDFSTNELARQIGPTKDDLNGNWGVLTNDAQASIRFPKNSYTNGEPIIATILVRNYSTNETLLITGKRAPHAPMEFVITDDNGKLLERKKSSNSTSEPEVQTFDPNIREQPLRQIRFKQGLDAFDLHEPGTYTIYGWDDVAQLNYSRKKAQNFILTTGKATFHVAAPIAK